MHTVQCLPGVKTLCCLATIKIVITILPILSLSHCICICRDLELNRSSSAVSMSCDTSDYSYAAKLPGQPSLPPAAAMTELLEEPVEEKPEQVGDIIIKYIHIPD